MKDRYKGKDYAREYLMYCSRQCFTRNEVKKLISRAFDDGYSQCSNEINKILNE